MSSRNAERTEQECAAVNMIEGAKDFVVIAYYEDAEKYGFQMLYSSRIAVSGLLDYGMMKHQVSMDTVLRDGKTGTIDRDGFKTDDNNDDDTGSDE